MLGADTGGVAGGRGFADLSPCVSGRQWFRGPLTGDLEPLDGVP